MLDITKAKITFKNYIEQYEGKNKLSFKLKVIHTYNVAQKAKDISTMLGLSQEDIELAELIGLLHDIGRFEELKVTGEYNSLEFDHAIYGSKILFSDGLIRNFIDDNRYDEIIKKSIENHNRLEIEEGLDERTLLHSKIIRDADKLDNYRVKKEVPVEAIVTARVNKREDIEESLLSDKVYEAVLHEKCVNVYDRATPLDFLVCILAFTFDLNFDVTNKIVKENDYINILIDRFDYKKEQTKQRMEKIRDILNGFVDRRI